MPALMSPISMCCIDALTTVNHYQVMRQSSAVVSAFSVSVVDILVILNLKVQVDEGLNGL